MNTSKTEIEAGKEAGHTPTPWGIEQTESNNWIGQMRPDCAKVGVIVTHTDRAGYNPIATARQDANARFICKAVNCHEELVEALEAITKTLKAVDDDHDLRESFHQATRALAKAKGEA